jgi:hypothetical protein
MSSMVLALCRFVNLQKALISNGLIGERNQFKRRCNHF